MAKSIKYREIKNINTKLSKTQEEILILITKGDPIDKIPKPLTVLEIAKKRKTSEQAVRKTIKKLKEKGILTHSRSNNRINKEVIAKKIEQGTPWRGHGQNFTIEILGNSVEYLNYIKDKSEDRIDNNKVMLYKNKIVFYGKKDFWGKDVEDVRWQLQEYTTLIISKIENKRNVLLKKPNKIKIKEFRFHLANVNDPDAKKFLEQGKQIKIRDENGFIRLEMDNSFVPEIEFPNRETCFEDGGAYERHRKSELFNPQAYTVSELTDILNKSTIENKKLSENVLKLSENITKQSETINFLMASHKSTEQSLKTTIDSQRILIEAQTNFYKSITKKYPETKADLEDIGNYFN